MTIKYNLQRKLDFIWLCLMFDETRKRSNDDVHCCSDIFITI